MIAMNVILNIKLIILIIFFLKNLIKKINAENELKKIKNVDINVKYVDQQQILKFDPPILDFKKRYLLINSNY